MKTPYIKEVSIYNHDKFSTDKFGVIRRFVDTYLEKHIDLYDMFGAINSFINFKNEEKDNVFEVEGKIIGVKNLLSIAGVIKPSHVEIFEDIACNYFTSEVLLLSEQKKYINFGGIKQLEFRDQGYIIE
jgi:hypothetical protein